ncbi:MAG: TlpA family protein disulfide reductase [Acidimicrobiia bacterium]|nr:TlpA family protein disulfide reductase [Acidimicrobiia bacterium]
MGTLHLIDVDGAEHELDADRLLVAAADLEGATDWVLKPEGLCRGDACVPLLGRPVARQGRIDLAEWAAALRLNLAVDSDHGVAALTPPADARAELEGGPAPNLALPDVDGNIVELGSLAGRKRVLVTWASWCGCRHELGAWQALQEELGPEGLSIYSVALDASADDAKPWIEEAAPTYPVVVDTAHVTAERYGITNVPSTVWIDEDGTVVKPPAIAPGDDQFRDFTEIDSSVHHDALRRWVLEGEVPEAPVRADDPRTDDGQLALAHRRVAAWLQARGHDEPAAAHLATAVDLAPWDWTVRRAGIKLRGGDPFLGDEFLTFWQEWDEAGRPGYR